MTTTLLANCIWGGIPVCLFDLAPLLRVRGRADHAERRVEAIVTRWSCGVRSSGWGRTKRTVITEDNYGGGVTVRGRGATAANWPMTGHSVLCHRPPAPAPTWRRRLRAGGERCAAEYRTACGRELLYGGGEMEGLPSLRFLIQTIIVGRIVIHTPR